MGPDAMTLVFWMLNFKPPFHSPLFIFIKRLFRSSSLSVIRMVCAYLRLVIFLPAILIPAYASSSPAFLMMCSAYKLNKQADNTQPWHTPFPVWNQSVVPCPVLTVASWPAYRFLKRQVKWSGIPISFRIFHSLLWSTQSDQSMLFSLNLVFKNQEVLQTVLLGFYRGFTCCTQYASKSGKHRGGKGQFSCQS